MAWDMLRERPDIDSLYICHQKVIDEKELILNQLPCYSLGQRMLEIITPGLVMTKDPETDLPNAGVYRPQRQSAKT